MRRQLWRKGLRGTEEGFFVTIYADLSRWYQVCIGARAAPHDGADLQGHMETPSRVSRLFVSSLLGILTAGFMWITSCLPVLYYFVISAEGQKTQTRGGGGGELFFLASLSLPEPKESLQFNCVLSLFWVLHLFPLRPCMTQHRKHSSVCKRDVKELSSRIRTGSCSHEGEAWSHGVSWLCIRDFILYPKDSANTTGLNVWNFASDFFGIGGLD